MWYYFLTVVFTPSFGPRFLVVDLVDPRFNPHLIRGGFFLYTGRVLHVDPGVVVFRFAYLVLLPPPTSCLIFDTVCPFFYKILRALFLGGVGQFLTFFSFVAEEQCCMLRAPHTLYWLGGYWVGSKPSQIKGLEKPHML